MTGGGYTAVPSPALAELLDRMRKEISDEIDALRDEKQALLLEDANRTAMKQKLDELETFLDEHQEPVTDYDEGMVRGLIERITVFEDHLAFEFKCGLETEVQI